MVWLMQIPWRFHGVLMEVWCNFPTNKQSQHVSFFARLFCAILYSNVVLMEFPWEVPWRFHGGSLQVPASAKQRDWQDENCMETPWVGVEWHGNSIKTPLASIHAQHLCESYFPDFYSFSEVQPLTLLSFQIYLWQKRANSFKDRFCKAFVVIFVRIDVGFHGVLM